MGSFYWNDRICCIRILGYLLLYQVPKPEINEDDELDLETEQEKQVKNSCKMFFVVLKMKKQNDTDGVCRL